MRVYGSGAGGMISYSYDDRIFATDSLATSHPGAFRIVDYLISLGIQVYARAMPEVFQTNRFLILKGIEQGRRDVVDGIRDSARPDDQHPKQRADALMYFIQPAYRQCLDYLNIKVTGDGLPVGVDKWIKYMGTWCRGIPLCSPMYTDEEAIAWGYRNGWLEQPDPWAKAEPHYRHIQAQLRRLK